MNTTNAIANVPQKITNNLREISDLNKKYFPTPLQEFMFYDKYAQWIHGLQRREIWPEAVDRVMRFLKKNTAACFTNTEWDRMRAAMLEMRTLPSLRILQMAGPALEKDNTGAYNCAYAAIQTIDSFSELLYILMQGTGIGFSVERRYVNQLPRVQEQKPLPAVKWTISDSTESWCTALKIGMCLWYTGYDVEFDFSKIRPTGSLLRTKGGRSSGPEPLKNLLSFVRSTILARQGNKLTTIDCHDIVCFCGYIVQVGGVRRAALLSLSDPDDRIMAMCKNDKFWEHSPYRMMANNSAAFEKKPSIADFIAEWLNLIASGTGERGIFNRNCAIPDRRERAEFGLNPCGEIILKDRQFCNLSICVARKEDTIDSLEEKIRIATMFGTAQAMLTYFPYLDPAWKENCCKERLLGVDITGQRDCPLLNGPGAGILFSRLRTLAIDTNKDLSERFHINQSVSVTCAKPNGNSSQLLDCSSGIHVRFSPYYIRRVRAGAHTPVSRLLKDSGIPYSVETGQTTENATILVFEFPIKSPENAILRKDVSAVDQFEYWLTVKTAYTEHNPSCTIYVADDEWLQLGARIYENWDRIGGLSFLPKNNTIYPLAPYEEISKDEYESRISSFPEVNYAKLVEYEQQDETSNDLDYACVSGSCEL